MTRAPENLLAVRRLLLTHLDIHENSSAYPTDLDPAEVGIVGDPAHRGGYHCGADRVVSNDYSVVESSRDRAGLDDNACGLDVGLFRVTTPKGVFDLPHYSRWLVAQCAAGTADTRDIREVIYSPDGKVVRRWDRLKRRSTGDSSHLFHTHQSYFRDAIKAGRDQTAVVRRYLTTIGLIEAPPAQEDDMTPGESWALHVMNYRLEAIKSNRATINVPARPDLGPEYKAYQEPNLLAAAAADAKTRDAAILAAVSGENRDAILAAIEKQGEQTRAQLAAQAAEDAKRDNDLAELLRAAQSGELTAEQVLAKLRDLLPAGGTAAAS